MELGIDLGFARKRWPEPERWGSLVREELGLGRVPFSFGLLDPWWPERERRMLAEQVRRAADDFDRTIHSARIGHAWYAFNGLLHPDAAARKVARAWWRRAAATAAELGVPAIGGPFGALSAADAGDAEIRAECYSGLLNDAVAASEAAAGAGLQALLVEPTPLPREIPHTVAQAQRFVADLEGRLAVPIRWLLGVGHALYRPLYGESVALEDWLGPLRGEIGLFHLQNHDYRSGAHWGWPHDGGCYDVADFAQAVRQEGLAHVPVVIELAPPSKCPMWTCSPTRAARFFIVARR